MFRPAPVRDPQLIAAAHARAMPALKAMAPMKSDLEIELMCSVDRNLQAKTGLTAHEWRKLAMSRMFPSRVWHDWREERIQSVQYCLEKGIQELMWGGSSSSCKTGDMADTVITLWLTRPEKTTVYITSPYETATETGLWAEIQERFYEAKDHNPGMPGSLRKTDSSIVLYDKNPRSFIRVTTVDQIGKLVGKKSVDANEGLIIIAGDELPAFSALAARNFVKVMANLRSNPNLLVMGAGNFALPGDAFGVFCDPNEDDIRQGYDGFDPDKHYRWRTKRGGLALRFDGLQSPNVRAGKDLYPFVTTLAYIGKIAQQPGGLTSPDAMRYVRSAPLTNLDEYTVTNGERIRAGGCYDDFQWTREVLTKIAFFDPGFGGDACIFQRFKLGHQQLAGGGTRQVLALDGPPEEIIVKVGLLDDQGSPVPVEVQVAKGAKALAEKHQIPFRNIGYDGSMRAALAQAVAVHFSPQVIPIDSQGPATERPVSVSEKDQNKEPVKWKARVDRFLSELWFAAAGVIDSYQLRGLEHSPKAAAQLCARRWNWAGKKKAVETKKEFKDSLIAQGKKGESPNEADALVGGIEIARRMGFTVEGVAPGGSALDTLLGMINDRGRRQARDLVNNFNPEKRETLPTGRLHGMAKARGKLHHR